MQDLYNTPKSGSKSTVKGAKKKIQNALAYKILVKPLVTEKATNLASENKYVFVVSKKANKISVAQAIQEVYGVQAQKINIMNVSGKRVVRGKIKGKRSDWRKAIVTLKAGESIKIYEGV